MSTSRMYDTFETEGRPEGKAPKKGKTFKFRRIMGMNVSNNQVAEATAVVNHVESPVRRRKQKSKFEKALQGTRNLWAGRWTKE